MALEDGKSTRPQRSERAVETRGCRERRSGPRLGGVLELRVFSQKPRTLPLASTQERDGLRFVEQEGHSGCHVTGLRGLGTKGQKGGFREAREAPALG